MPARHRSPVASSRLRRRHARRRLAVGLATVALLVAAGVVAAVLAAGGGPPRAPLTAAARLVGAGALAYVDVSTDETRPGVRDAQALLARLPVAAGLVRSVVRSLGLSRGVRPWLGREAALALVPAGRRARSLLLLDVADRAGAIAYLAALPGLRGRIVYRGTPLARYPGFDAGLVGRFLVIGPRRLAERAIDLRAGRGAALARDPVYRRATAGLPADRVAAGYAPQRGLARALAPRSGALGTLARLAGGADVQAVAVAASAGAHDARFVVRRIVAPIGPAAFGLRRFEPTLAGRLSASTIAYLGVDDLARAGPALLADPGPVGGLARDARRVLARRAGIDLQRDVLDALPGEVALGLTPGPGITLVARARDPAAARTALAELQPGLERLLAIPGTRPSFAPVRVAGTAGYVLRVTSRLAFAYAVADGRLAVSTSLAGLRAALAPGDELTGATGYRAAVGDGSAPVASVGFLDLPSLLRLAAATGLTTDSRLAAARRALAEIDAVGLRSTPGPDQSTTELSLQIP